MLTLVLQKIIKIASNLVPVIARSDKGRDRTFGDGYFIVVIWAISKIIKIENVVSLDV